MTSLWARIIRAFGAGRGEVERTPDPVAPVEGATSTTPPFTPYGPVTVKWASPQDFTTWAQDKTTGSVEFATDVPIGPPVPRSWADHETMMAAHQQYSGWLFCQFGVRGPTVHDYASVQGIVRPPFGAWWAPFLCRHEETAYTATQGLACVEHVPSGMAIGVFGSMDLAVEAAEIAGRVVDWHGFTLDAVNIDLIRRLTSVWQAAGIVKSPFIGYPMVNEQVSPHQPPVLIFIKNEQAAAGVRPEKLS